jgi:hypothetical protein
MTEIAEGARECMNNSGTCTQVDAELTQPRSWSDHRAALILKREVVGADTPAGRNISTLVEQIENRRTYVRPSWAKDRRQTLDYQIEKSLNRLSDAM